MIHYVVVLTMTDWWQIREVCHTAEEADAAERRWKVALAVGRRLVTDRDFEQLSAWAAQYGIDYPYEDLEVTVVLYDATRDAR